MNKNQIKAAKAALDAKTYTLAPSGKGRQAALAAFLAPGKPGERLAQAGWSEELLAACVADLACRALSAGKSADELTSMLRAIGATNSSAAMQAARELAFAAPDLAPKEAGTSWTLGDVWQHCLGAGAAIRSTFDFNF